MGTVAIGYWVDFLRSSFVLGTFDKKLIQAVVRDSGYRKRRGGHSRERIKLAVYTVGAEQL